MSRALFYYLQLYFEADLRRYSVDHPESKASLNYLLQRSSIDHPRADHITKDQHASSSLKMLRSGYKFLVLVNVLLTCCGSVMAVSPSVLAQNDILDDAESASIFDSLKRSLPEWIPGKPPLPGPLPSYPDSPRGPPGERPYPTLSRPGFSWQPSSPGVLTTYTTKISSTARAPIITRRPTAKEPRPIEPHTRETHTKEHHTKEHHTKPSHTKSEHPHTESHKTHSATSTTPSSASFTTTSPPAWTTSYTKAPWQPWPPHDTTTRDQSADLDATEWDGGRWPHETHKGGRPWGAAPTDEGGEPWHEDPWGPRQTLAVQRGGVLRAGGWRR